MPGTKDSVHIGLPFKYRYKDKDLTGNCIGFNQLDLNDIPYFNEAFFVCV